MTDQKLDILYTQTADPVVKYNITGVDVAEPTNVYNQCLPLEEVYPGLFHVSQTYLDQHGYVAAAVCVFGIAGNLANTIVLTRKNMASSTNFILTWLAVADLMTMLSYLPVSIHFYILRDPNLHFPTSYSVHWIRFMLFHINFSVVCHTIAIWLTIALAIFRYLFICYPTRGSELCSIKNAKIAVAIIYIATAIICIPNYLVTAESKKLYDLGPNITRDNSTEQLYYYTVKDSELGRTSLSTANYWIQAVFFKLVPCGTLTALTILLIIAMHQAHQRRIKLITQGKKDESERAREHNRTTAMLLAIVGLFLVTELPQGILTMLSIFVHCFFSQVYWPMGDILDIAALLNNSINFVLYCTMSGAFRNTFKQIFCPQGKTGWLKVRTNNPTDTSCKNNTDSTMV